MDFPHRRRPSGSPGVSFATDLEVKIVKNISHEDLWFTEQDIQACKRRIALLLGHISSIGVTVAQIAMDNIHDTSAFCGLENYMSKNTAIEIHHRRRAVRKAVLAEQRRQIETGIRDPEIIANIAAHGSRLSTKRAHIIGLLHAENRATS